MGMPIEEAISIIKFATGRNYRTRRHVDGLFFSKTSNIDYPAISIIPATRLSYARSPCRAIRWLSFDWMRISSAQCSKPMNQSQTWRKARFTTCERGFRFSPRRHIASMLEVDGWWDTPKKASASVSLRPRSPKRPSITARGKHRCD